MHAIHHLIFWTTTKVSPPFILNSRIRCCISYSRCNFNMLCTYSERTNIVCFARSCTPVPVHTTTFLRKHDGFTDFVSVLSAPSHNRDSVPVRVERSVFEFRLLRGTRHIPADRTVVRRTDQVPSCDRAHVSVRLHLVQSAARQTPVRHRIRHCFHAVAARLHPVHGTRTLETGNH